ncbi:glycosyltransferase family 9 protein [Prosthecobacter sp.]|uniref:glycosyltransferase family 9 protein n=1 Tax=Prosthecobacter sp. TaxID=1965333 RepID=UPI001D9CFE0E|nr:glycosyltransferase family 9 protein [Prosthecobacter sp.]MCB1275302.1 glycosyltransferase family 9 protein [Prosthecobacter sp.]
MKTLVAYHKQLGDTLLLQPALAKLAWQDGGPVGLATRPGFADLVNLMPDVHWVPLRPAPAVDRLLTYDVGDRSSLVSLWVRAREKHLLIFSSFYVRFYHRWIFDQIHLRNQEQMYRAFYFWSFTPGPVQGQFEPPVLLTPPSGWLPPEVPTKPFMLVHATSAWQRKCWPASMWREAIRNVYQLTRLPVVLTGGTTEWEKRLCSEIAQGMPEVINFGGRTSLRGIMALASSAEAVFAVDGFVSHLATAFRRPCLTLFGPTNVNHWHFNAPTTCAVYPGDEPGAAKGRKITEITVAAMLDKARKWLRRINLAS